MSKTRKKFTTISVPTTLFDKLKERINGTGFTSVSSYVIYVMREIIAEKEADSRRHPFSEEDEKRVKDRLRALGYLD